MLQICSRSAQIFNSRSVQIWSRSGADLEQNSRSGADLEQICKFCSRSAPDLHRSGVVNLCRSGADLMQIWSIILIFSPGLLIWCAKGQNTTQRNLVNKSFTMLMST